MKITRRQLRRIIKEEKQKLLAEQPISGEQAVQMQHDQNPLFNPQYIKDLFFNDFADIEPGDAWVSEESFTKFEGSVLEAVEMLRRDFVGR